MKKNINMLCLFISINLFNALNSVDKSLVSASTKSAKTATSKKIKSNSKVISEISSINEIDTSKPVVLELYSKNCGSCHMFKQSFEKLATKYPDITFLKADIQKNSALAQKYSISY